MRHVLPLLRVRHIFQKLWYTAEQLKRHKRYLEKTKSVPSPAPTATRTPPKTAPTRPPKTAPAEAPSAAPPTTCPLKFRIAAVAPVGCGSLAVLGDLEVR
eukprot:GHVO01032845.1.p3 GENE.GHVO01032845.1~~GHVO01032845.1.p3  ORF type:complete len:100 (-),score=18.68 GHVO01032845.1:103-402(-)